jgi:nucleoside-diphosphate-sugar epimerase
MPRARSSATKILVTGATGFLGKHVVDHLLEQGEKQVRILTTSPPDWLRSKEVETIEGSITSPEIMAVAADGVQQIYHLAGRVSRSEDEKRQMYSVHVDGTRVLCEAAKKARVRRIVMASTSGTIAVTEDGYEIPNEEWPTPIEIISKFPYYSSKLYQEKTARVICGTAVELVILNPSLLLGPGDDRLSSTEDVLKFLAGEIPATPSGGINFVDVRDVAPVFYTAMQKGTPGERYLLGGPNWTLERFFGHLERASKVSAPKFKVPKRFHTISSRLVEVAYKTIGKTPPLDAISMEMSRYFWYVDSTKAKEELEFESRDPQDTLYDTVEHLREHFLGADIFE